LIIAQRMKQPWGPEIGGIKGGSIIPKFKGNDISERESVVSQPETTVLQAMANQLVEKG
jgi:hypothetical protein